MPVQIILSIQERTTRDQEGVARSGRSRERLIILVLRLLHGLITLYFLACIACIYYAGLTDQMNGWVQLAAGSLLVEAGLILIYRGNCPLGGVHRKFGDQKTFFELFLPRSLASLAVPFFGVVAVAGFLLLFM